MFIYHGKLPSLSCQVADYLGSTYCNMPEKIVSRLKDYSKVDIYYVNVYCKAQVGLDAERSSTCNTNL